ncbi:MAG: hypothetical protein RLZ95_1019 [Bacteroidota bacterium]
MVFLFRDRSDINLLFLVLLSVGLHFHNWVTPPMVIANASDGLLPYILVHYIRPLSPLILIILFQVIILSQAIRLNILMSKLKMFQHVSYLPGFTYIILTALFPYWDVISSGLVANSLVIWILVKLLRLYDQNQPKSLEFNIGLILGISILLYSPIAILIPVVLFALTIIRPFKLAEWLVLLMGILLPFYFIFTFVYLTSGVQEFTHYLPRLDWKNPLIKPNLKILLTLALILVQFLAGLYYWQEQQSRFIIQVRKYWGVLLLVLILTLFQPIIFSTQALYASAIVLTPLACFISFAYSVPKSLFIPNILFWSAIAVIVYNHLG